MKTMYLKRLFKHLFVFQIISLHRALDVIFMILFPRVWIKRVNFSSMPEGHNFRVCRLISDRVNTNNSFYITSLKPREALHFCFDTKTKQKSQDKVERLNYGSDFYNQTNSLRSNKSDYLTKSSNNSLRLTQPRSVFADESNWKLSKTFPLPLARAIALLVSLLFSYLTVTPAFGQEPVGLGGCSVSAMLENVKIIPDTSSYRLNKERSKYYSVDFNHYPLETYIIDNNNFPKIEIGDTIPDCILDLPLWVVNDGSGRDTLTLRTEMNKDFLILDFWKENCSPCVISMTKWEKLIKEYNSNFNLLGVYVGYSHPATSESIRFNFKSPQIIGSSFALLSHLFFSKYVLGPSVWIKDKKLFGISKALVMSENDVKNVLTGTLTEIPIKAQYIN